MKIHSNQCLWHFLSFFLLTALLYNYIALAMQQVPVQYTTKLVLVPGKNGLGGIINGEIISNTDIVLPQLKDKRHCVETPALIPDFGQERCLSYLHKTLTQELECTDSAIIHASSQGTATTINYAANQKEHPAKIIKGMILEAVMLTGNSAIYHTTEKTVSPFITCLPGSYYWLPYLVKIRFPNYTPAGEQPIFNVDKLPKNIPIIIIHNVYDPQLSFKDAQALYAHLKNNNENVYLFTHNNGDAAHVLLLEEDRNKSEIAAIQTILKKHKLLPANEENPATPKVDLTSYQPEVKQEWLDHFDTILNKEKKMWYFDKVLEL